MKTIIELAVAREQLDSGDYTVEVEPNKSYVIKVSNSTPGTFSPTTSGGAVFFEVDDTLIRFNSGVLLPDALAVPSDGVSRPGLDVVAQCLRYAAGNTQKRILIAGHADTKGAADHNVKLSAIRTDAIHGMLTGDRAQFANACFGPHLSEEQRYPDGGSGAKKGVLWDDYTDVLNWAAEYFGWPCGYPVQNSTLWAATVNFQKSYNLSDVGDKENKPIPEWGSFTKDTWAAVFDCYEVRLAELLGKDAAGMQSMRAGLVFLNELKHCVACGEFKPIDQPGRDNYRSQTNRRVEIAFFDPDEAPALPCFTGTCSPDICPVYDSPWTPIDLGSVGPEGNGKLYMQVFNGSGETALAQRAYSIYEKDSGGVAFSGQSTAQGVIEIVDVPPGNYELEVADCCQKTCINVLPASMTHPQIRFLEDARLTILAQTDNGAPIADATVTVDGLGEQYSDDDGIADFGQVMAGDYSFVIEKEGYDPVDGTVAALDERTGGGAVSGNVTVTNARVIGQGTLKQTVTDPLVVRIDAQADCNHSIRNPSESLGNGQNKLRSSKSSSRVMVPVPGSPSADINPPVVLIRGGGEIHLEAKTNPPGSPVTWSVEKNDNPVYLPPGLVDLGNNKATVKTDRTGSFSVVAKIGASEKVWNFILVAVKVDIDNSSVKAKNDFADIHTRYPTMSKSKDGASSGEFPRTPTLLVKWGKGFHAWSAEVIVNLEGGGSNYDLGLDKIEIGYLQNLTYNDGMGHYKNGATAMREFVGPYIDYPEKSAGRSIPYPKVDTKNGVGQCPLILSTTMCKPTTALYGKQQTFVFGDSPALGFDTTVGTQQLVSLTGYQKYRAAVASYSKDAVNMIVAHAECEWLSDYTGTFDSTMNYSSAGAHTTAIAASGGKAWRLINSAQHGRSASVAGFELFPPTAMDQGNKAQQNKF